MVSTPFGLGVSLGWTKSQATEPADHNTEKTCKDKDVFPTYFYQEKARASNPDKRFKDNTKYYGDCHRKVLKSVTTRLRQMKSQDHNRSTTYNTGKYFNLILKSRNPNLNLNTSPIPNKSMGETVLCN